MDILHAEYDQLSQALVESREAFASSRRGRSPDVASPGVASPAAAPRPPRPDSSSRTGLRLSPQPGPSSSGDSSRTGLRLSPQPGPSSSGDSHLGIVVVHVTPQAIVPVKAEFQKIAHASDSPLETSLATDGDSLQGIPPLQSVDDSLQRIPIHLSVGTHPVPRLVMVLLRDPHHGLLLPVHLRLLGKIKTLMNLLCLPQFGL